MYKLMADIFTNEAVGVKRLSDGAGIPFDPANRDFAEYLRWLEEGNEPLPAEQPTAAEQPAED